MRGCTLYTDVAVTLDVSTAGGVGTVALAIPNVTALVGRHFFAQAFVADPADNQLGVTATNVVDGHVGAR